MITPAGDAPPGAVLTITPSRRLDAKARLVGFGGIDPSGAAYPLPAVLGKTATLPVTEFGGYGIVEPVARRARIAGRAGRPRIACAPDGAHAAAAGGRPITSCSSAAQRLKALADALAPEISKGRQEEMTGVQLDSTTRQDLESAFTGLLEALNQEAARVLNQEPTDEGDAELQVLTTIAIGIERQAQLLGLPETGDGRTAVGDIVQYGLKNIQRACTGTQTASQLLAHAMRAFIIGEQAERMGVGGLQPDPGALRAACLLRVRISLDVSDDSSIEGGSSFDGQHVKISADGITIAGRDDPNAFGGVALHAADANLTYDSATITLNSPFNQIGTARYTGKSGYVHVNKVGYSASSHVRCDKNRHFVVDRDVRLWLEAAGIEALWNDVQKIDITEEGTDLGTHTETVEASVWGLGLDAGSIPKSMPVVLEVPPDQTKEKTEEKGTGPCRGVGGSCTYAYDATFDATGLPAAASDR
jgi:hypothetical protein